MTVASEDIPNSLADAGVWQLLLPFLKDFIYLFLNIQSTIIIIQISHSHAWFIKTHIIISQEMSFYETVGFFDKPGLMFSCAWIFN